MERKYGFIKGKEDTRDLRYSISKPAEGLPSKSDLRNQFPPCYDQLQTSSCTGNGTIGALQSAQFHAEMPSVMLSRLFAYYNARKEEGDPSTDGGAEIRDVIKACNVYGIVEETMWPFSEDAVTKEPSWEVYEEAITDRIHFYASVDLTNADHIKVALSHGLPVVFGFDVYSYFESEAMAKKGILNIPGSHESNLGGHCVVIVGHDDSTKMFLVRNSWGTDWGINGYFWMSYDYVTSDLASDGWVIRLK